MTASAARIICPGFSPQCAPAARNGCAASRSRSRTVRSNPLRNREPASFPPTLPSPMKPIFMCPFSTATQTRGGRCLPYIGPQQRLNVHIEIVSMQAPLWHRPVHQIVKRGISRQAQWQAHRHGFAGVGRQGATLPRLTLVKSRSTSRRSCVRAHKWEARAARAFAPRRKQTRPNTTRSRIVPTPRGASIPI